MPKNNRTHYRAPMILISVVIALVIAGVIASFLQYRSMRKDIKILQAQVRQMQE